MVHVVDYIEFEALVARVERAEAQVAILTDLLLGFRWLNRNQTMQALNVSRMTLHRMTKSGKLTHRYEGSRPLYCATSLRAYMDSQKIEGSLINQRLMAAGMKQ